MSGILTKIKCLLLTSLWVLTLPVGFLIAWIPNLYSSFDRARLRLLRRLDSAQECWLVSYLERRQRITEQYPAYSLETSTQNPIEHIDQLVQELGLCPEVIVRCATLAEIYINRQRWQEAEEILQRGYQLAYEWYKQPSWQRRRSLFDQFTILPVATHILVALWVFKKCREEGRNPSMDSSYGGWLLKLAFGSGVDRDTFWHVWYPEARRHFVSIPHSEPT